MLKIGLCTWKFYKEAIGKNKCTYICPVLYFLYYNVLQEGQQRKKCRTWMLLCLANTVISMKNKVALT